jgi:hypothetical protein
MDLHGRAAQPGMTEREHHGWGALLKYVEALATAYRYGRYPRNSKTGKLFERFLTATRQLRNQLNWEYGWVATEPLRPENWPDRDFRDSHQAWLRARDQALTSSVYYGDEVRYLHQQVLTIEEAPTGLARKLFPPDPNEFEIFKDTVEQLVSAARCQTQKLPWHTPASLPLAPPALPTHAARPKADRHAVVRAALLENPDRPQAAFVKLCRVHPNTVRRCRQELEQAGAIPYLAHRHGPAQASLRRVKLEAAD